MFSSTRYAFFRNVKNVIEQLGYVTIKQKTTTGDEAERQFLCSSHLLHELRLHSWECNLQVLNLGS